MIDYDAIPRMIYGSMFGDTPPEAHATDESYSSYLAPFFMNRLWASDYGKSVAKMAEEKNRPDLMYDPKSGRLRSPYVVGPELAGVAINPKLTAGEQEQAQKAVPAFQEQADLVGKVQNLLETHPEYFNGPRSSPVMEEGARYASPFIGNWMGAQDQASGQADIHRVLSDAFLNNVKTLQGTGAVRNSELGKIDMKSPTLGLSDIPTWKTWLRNAQKISWAGSQVNSKVAQGDLSVLPTPKPAGDSAQGAQQNQPFQPNDYKMPADLPDKGDQTLQFRLVHNFMNKGISPDRAAGAKLYRTAADYQDFKSGQVFYNTDGEIGVKP